MFKKIFLIAFIVSVSVQAVDEDMELHPAFVGKQMEVLTDKVSRIKTENHPNDCFYFREYVVKFAYASEEHQYIYYHVY